MISETELINIVCRLAPNLWYTGKELDTTWGVTTPQRKGLIAHAVKRGMLKRKGTTSKTRYMLILDGPKPTGNGVIDAKLRKEANLPATTSSLENLIAAATTLGTENEVMRNKLDRIRAILDEA